MSNHTIRERNALRYAAIKADGDRDVRAASKAKHASSPTPSFQRWFEDRGGWFIALIVGFALAALTACGPMRARPDLKVSTLTESSVSCVRGHKTEQVGTTGLYGTPVVLVTAERCGVTP